MRLEIMVPSSRLHQQVVESRSRLNPALDVMDFASDRAVHRFQRISQRELSEEEPQTVFVNMQVDAEEEFDTKYVNLYIDTGSSFNSKFDQRETSSIYSPRTVLVLVRHRKVRA